MPVAAATPTLMSCDFCQRIHISVVCLRVSDSISIQFIPNFKWFFVIVAAIVATVDAFDIVKYERCAGTSQELMNTQKNGNIFSSIGY